MSLGRRGAGPAYAYEAVKALLKKAKLFVICSSYCEILSKWQQLQKEGVIDLLQLSTFHSFPEFLHSSLFLCKLWQKVAPFLFYSKPDIIYYPMGHTWDFYLDKRFTALGIPIVHTIHEPNSSTQGTPFEKSLTDFGIQSNVAFSSGIILLSSFFFDSFVKKWEIESDRIRIIPHAIFSDYALSLQEPCDMPIARKETVSVLFFGRIDKFKGLNIVYQAFEKASEIDRRLHLFIYGKGKLEKFKPKSFRKENSKVHEVNRWIQEQEIPAIFRQSDFLLLPFNTHAQSGVIAMAYAFCKPVISSKVGGVPEQVFDGVTGLLCDAGDICGFTDKILELSSNSLLYSKLMTGIIEKRTFFSWEQSASMLLQFFESVLNRKQSGSFYGATKSKFSRIRSGLSLP